MIFAAPLVGRVAETVVSTDPADGIAAAKKTVDAALGTVANTGPAGVAFAQTLGNVEKAATSGTQLALDSLP